MQISLFQFRTKCSGDRQAGRRLFAGLVGLVLIAIATGPLTGQESQRRGSRSGISRYLKRLDRNRNEILDQGEIVGNAASYLQSLGFDTSQPISLSKVLRKVEGDQQDGDENKKSNASSVVRKVPGFGVTAEEREGVSKFGGNGDGGGIDMNAKYGERVMQLVQRTLDGYDANKNGSLDPEEVKAARWGSPTPEESDANHDGVLSQVELADRYLARDRDANANGSSNRRGNDPNQGRRVTVTNGRATPTNSNNFSRNRVRTSRPSSTTSVRQDSNGRSSNSRNYGNRSVSTRSNPTVSTNSSTDRYARYAAGLITQYDQNKDGKLDTNEIGKMRRPPKNADIDGDGFVTTEELTSSLSGNTNPSAASSRSPTSPTTVDPQARSGQTGQSRYSSSNRSPGSRRPTGSFSDYDKNQDGQIQMHEFSEEWDGEIFAQFQAKDANGDGIITASEWSGR